ncbi:MAG: alpha-L-rhamnosidase C-terminal domain-containing protein, partial [Bacteroidales bacterium]
ILLQPKVGGEMQFAKGHFVSPYGKIASGWEKNPSGGYTYRVTLPANTTATLSLAASGTKQVTVTQGKEGVGPLRFENGKVLAELKSGSYEFVVK